MREGTIVGLAGLAGSMLLIVLGLVWRRRAAGGKGTPALVLGILGLALSSGWLILGAYIDAVTS